MPLFVKKEISKDVSLAIWEITESLENLLSLYSIKKKEINTFNLITNEGRKKQWIATRLALSELDQSQNLVIAHNNDRSPYLNDTRFSISISHTQNFVAVILGKGQNLGVDIEQINPRIYKIRHKFCSDAENKYLTDDELLLPRLYVIWSAKEALFKIYGKGNLDFRKNLSIEPFIFNPPGILKTQINCNDLCEEVELNYDQVKDHILVYGMNEFK